VEKRSTAGGDLHWIAGAIECTVDEPGKVTASLVSTVADTLFQNLGLARAPHGDDPDSVDEADDAQHFVEDSISAFRHFASILLQRAESAETDFGVLSDWETVAWVLHRVRHA